MIYRKELLLLLGKRLFRRMVGASTASDRLEGLSSDWLRHRGVPSTKLSAKPGLLRVAALLSARVAFNERDLRESPLSNHGNLSDQTNWWEQVNCRADLSGVAVKSVCRQPVNRQKVPPA